MYVRQIDLYQKCAVNRLVFYQINVGTALSGPSILYGKAQPYLKTIDLHDHYYIQGPTEQKEEAVRVFANMGM